MPTVEPMAAATRPIITEMRLPRIKRLRMSRPNWSVPRMWVPYWVV